MEDTAKKMKRQLSEKIFVKDTSDKRLIKNIQRPLKAQQ